MVQLKDLMQGTQRYVCELRLQAQTVASLYASSCVIRLVPVFRRLPGGAAMLARDAVVQGRKTRHAP